jgi:hypothetical protein
LGHPVPDKAKLFVMPPREINSDAEEVVESIRRSEWDGILVIMAKDGGKFDMVSNQGDAGNVLLFLERFKRHVIHEADRINQIVNRPQPETPA